MHFWYVSQNIKYTTKESLKEGEKNTDILGFGEYIIHLISKSTDRFSLS